MSKRVQRGGTADGTRRKHRSRPTPKWLNQSQALDAIARSRCLMVLSVLSGEKPVTDAIVEAKISRGAYYQMETRALNAMLTALNPRSSPAADGSADLSAATTRIGELEEKLGRLEQEKRRSERLLLMVRKSIRSPVKLSRPGRPPKLLRSILSGKLRSPRLKGKAVPSGLSIPTTAGAAAS